MYKLLKLTYQEYLNHVGSNIRQNAKCVAGDVINLIKCFCALTRERLVGFFS